MRRVPLAARSLEAYAGCGVSITPHARVEQPVAGFGVDLAHYAAGAENGRHPTRLWQLFAVVSGSGWAAGSDGVRIALGPGDAVLLEPGEEPGEEHGSGSAGGMVVVIVQSPEPPLPLP